MKNIICMICVVYSTFVWIYAGIIDFDMAYYCNNITWIFKKIK